MKVIYSLPVERERGGGIGREEEEQEEATPQQKFYTVLKVTELGPEVIVFCVPGLQNQ